MSIKSLIPSLLVDSIEQTVEYYTKVLGFKLGNKNQYWADLSSGEARLYLTLKESVYSFLPEMKERNMGGGRLPFTYTLKELKSIMKKLRK
jgi:catechol 2,3-dioxygenase-like lactoylglutathione lyase family enzyme